MTYQDHNPSGQPCERCGLPDYRHRVDHAPIGNPCALCGLPIANHRKRNIGYKYRKRQRQTLWNKLHPHRERGPKEYLYVGIDGEGHGREKHVYTMLGANTIDGEGWYVENPNGLSTVECLDFILGLPFPRQRKRVFAYSFNYDLTKLLEDLDNKSLYLLFRPELRQRKGKAAKMGPKPVEWNGYKLNLQGTKFAVSKGGKSVTVWDLIRFYQCRFVQAIKDWKVGNQTEWDRMQAMKDNRAYFDELLRTGKITHADIRRYCLQECSYMAELGRKLIEAHEQAGLKLKSFYGAGSSGAAILNKLGIIHKIRPAPTGMHRAVASAFFGGRFENSRIGTIKVPRIFNYDISSAYPYQCAFLPCLVHAHWEKTSRRSEIDDRSLVRYRLNSRYGSSRNLPPWGPFPFRSEDGSICFPVASGGGWVWGQEFLEGERLFPDLVQFEEAWVYKGSCDCKPFAQIPHFYRERCRLGKEGPGIVLKLGPNSVYGKLAQSVGSAPFQSWIWAGLITSNTRAQILKLMRTHESLESVLMVATDGVMTLEEIEAPAPLDTGTFDLPKPLGGWEKDTITKGIFLARPGIYFPLDPQPEELKKVRARGVGKASVLEQWKKIVDSFERYGMSRTVQLANISRFCGAKTSISQRRDGTYHRSAAEKTDMAYGQWITRKVEMSFDPMPKRESVMKGGFLKVRRMPSDLQSVAYDRAELSLEAQELIELKQELTEQPDADMLDYEVHYE